MFGSSMLDIAVGVCFVFLLMSILATAINEIILSFMNKRGKFLLKGIATLLNEEAAPALDLAAKVYNHGQVCGLYVGDFVDPTQGNAPGGAAPNAPAAANADLAAYTKANKDRLPAYIPSRNFTLALLGIVASEGAANPTVTTDANGNVVQPVAQKGAVTQALRDGVTVMEQSFPKVGRSLHAMMVSAEYDLNKFEKAVEAWYDSGMDRVSGWYKYHTQWVLFWIGITMAVALNANTVKIVQQISRTPTMQQALVAAATNVKPLPTTDPNATVQALVTSTHQAVTSLNDLGLPIGWQDSHWLDWQHGFVVLIGWLCTAIAVSLGAPFWFDMLNKIMIIRSTVKPAEKSQEEGSKDKTSPQAAPTTAAAGSTGP